MLLDVDHVRVMRGETDEVVCRMRSDEVEREVVGIFEACGAAPDWFIDRWVCLPGKGEEAVGQMVTVAVFEDAAAAGKFEVEARRRVGCVTVRDDDVMRGEMADYFSAEWEKAHEAGLAKSKEVLGKCEAAGVLSRSFVGDVREDDDAGCRGRLKSLRSALEGLFGDGCAENDAQGPIAYGAVYDKCGGILTVCVVERAGWAGSVCPDSVLAAIRGSGIGFAPASERLRGGLMRDAEMSLVANVAGRVMTDEGGGVASGRAEASDGD